MPEVEGADKGNFKSETKPQAYAPSWVDRFTAWVERLPGPTWLYYIGLGPALLLVQIIVLGIDFMFGSPLGILATLFLALPSIIYRARLEEKALGDRFGQEWEAYEERTRF